MRITPQTKWGAGGALVPASSPLCSASDLRSAAGLPHVSGSALLCSTRSGRGRAVRASQRPAGRRPRPYARPCSARPGMQIL